MNPNSSPAESNLHVRTTGHGPPVVLVHSAGLSSTQWHPLAARLAPAFTVIAPDLWGYGKSPLPDHARARPVEADVEEVVRLVASSTEPVHLVGHSYGGAVALRAALRVPERLRGVTLFEPVSFGVLRSTGHAALSTLPRALDVPPDDDRDVDAAWVEAFVDYWNGQGRWRAMPAIQQGTFLRTAARSRAVVRALLEDSTGHAEVRAVRAPTLLLSAERSTTAARAVCEVLAAAMPHARHERLPVGHMGPVEEPDIALAPIVDHVRACGGVSNE